MSTPPAVLPPQEGPFPLQLLWGIWVLQLPLGEAGAAGVRPAALAAPGVRHAGDFCCQFVYPGPSLHMPNHLPTPGFATLALWIKIFAPLYCCGRQGLLLNELEVSFQNLALAGLRHAGTN